MIPFCLLMYFFLINGVKFKKKNNRSISIKLWTFCGKCCHMHIKIIKIQGYIIKSGTGGIHAE